MPILRVMKIAGANKGACSRHPEEDQDHRDERRDLWNWDVVCGVHSQGRDRGGLKQRHARANRCRSNRLDAPAKLSYAVRDVN